jgi:hypothetical protein
MRRLAPAALAALVFALALAAWTPAAEAGTAEAPEITDDAGDQEVCPVGTGIAPTMGQAAANGDILAGWIGGETADELHFYILSSGDFTDGTFGPYTYNFHATAGGTEIVATGVTGDPPTAGGVATAAAITDGALDLTVPKSAFAASEVGAELSALSIDSEGDADPPGVVVFCDAAAAEDGVVYAMTGGSGGGSGTAGDSDGDGLNDTTEEEQFGNLTAQNGTGDPDGDGLNNSAEFELGTNATKADTDGDGLDDKEDSDPLDPSKPGTGGNGTGNATADLDKDGLPDAWEKEHFNSTTAQTGANDPDTDGLDNKAEYAAGTDPNEADTDGDGLNDAADPKPLTAEAEGEDRLEMYAGAPMFAAIATLCLFALGRR